MNIKYNKLVISLLFGVISMIIAPAVAQSSNVVNIDDNISAPYGGTITVPIKVHNATGVAAVGLKLRYNASVVNVTGAEQGDFTSFFGFDNSNAANSLVTINTFIMGTQFTGDPVVSRVTLEATGSLNDRSSLDLEIITVSNKTGHELTVSTDNGSFIVSEMNAPLVTAPVANPPVISNDGSKATQLSVAVTDESDIDSVTIDLSVINGPPKQQMSRAGNVWTYTTSASAPPGTYELRVNATDTWGNSNTSVTIPLKLVEPALISTGNLTAPVAGSITIPLMIYNATDTASVGLKLSYNASVVNVTAAAQGDFTSFFGFDSRNASNGWVTINTFIIGSPLSGDLIIANITLKPIGRNDESSQLHFSNIVVTDQYGNNLPWRTSDGVFMILSSPPVLDTIGDRSVNEGSLLEFTVSATDLDGDSLIYSAINLPSGATFDTAIRTFSWTPAYDRSGSYPDVQFKVTDGNFTDSENITITVNNINREPTISRLVNQSGEIGISWTYDLSPLISDPDGDQLIVTADDTNVSVNSYVLTFNYSKVIFDKPIIITVSDGSLSSSQTIYVTVEEKIPPLLSYPTSSQLIPDDTDGMPLWGETSILNITITDNSEIASVTIDLSPIGGSSAQPMVSIGGNIWSVTTSAIAGTPPQIYQLQVNATDIYGNSNTSITIPLVLMRNGDTNGDSIVNIADAMLLANFVTNPGQYIISSEFVADVTGDGIVNITDAMLLANFVSFPNQYILR